MSIRIFDVETTGVRTDQDQIVELCIQFDIPVGAQKLWRIRPNGPIPPSATAIHGITDEMVRTAPSFMQVALEIREAFTGTEIIIGYNVDFDINILQAEFQRARMSPLDLSGVHVIDALGLWRVCEPRNLGAAHERFVGEKLEAAHSSAADVAATGRVLWHMIDAFGLGDISWADLALKSNPTRARWVGPSHHLQRTDSGDVVITFGKNKDQSVLDLARTDPRYLSWIMKSDFPNHVKTIAANAIRLKADDDDAFYTWVNGLYPPSRKGL